MNSRGHCNRATDGYLLSIILSPAVFDGPKWNAISWKHIYVEVVYKCKLKPITPTWIQDTNVLRIPQAAQRGQSSRGCRRSSRGEKHLSCRTKGNERRERCLAVSVEVNCTAVMLLTCIAKAFRATETGPFSASQAASSERSQMTTICFAFDLSSVFHQFTHRPHLRAAPLSC